MFRKLLPREKWFWGIAASVLSLCIIHWVLDRMGLSQQRSSTQNGGIHMQSFGVFGASNVLIIHEAKPTSTGSTESSIDTPQSQSTK